MLLQTHFCVTLQMRFFLKIASLHSKALIPLVIMKMPVYVCSSLIDRIEATHSMYSFVDAYSKVCVYLWNSALKT